MRHGRVVVQGAYKQLLEKILRVLGFRAKRSIADAAHDLCRTFKAGKLPNSMTNDRYYNVKTMKLLGAE